MVKWFWLLIVGVSCLIVGFIIGFFVIRSVFTKQLEKNPPINRDSRNVHANGKKTF